MPQVLKRVGHGIVLAAIAWACATAGCAGSRNGAASGGATADGSGGAGGAGSGGTAGNGGSGVPVGATFGDGTRLKARSYVVEGAAPLFVGIYDSQEQVACEFRQTTDGKLRCLPANAVGPADPATVLPPERWQEGAEIVGAATGLRLRQHRIASTDGGVFPDWISGPLADDGDGDGDGEPCLPEITREADGTGAGVCMPRHAQARGIDFSDAGCTQALAATSAVGVMPLLIASAKRDVFALGEQFQGPTFMKLGTDTAFSCVEFPAGSADYYRIGDQLPADTVAELHVVPRGSGRLMVQTIEFQGVGLTHVRHRALSSPFRDDGVYFDREQARVCRPTWTVAAELRCLPETAEYEPETWLTNFADPDCTQPVISSDRTSVVVLRTDASTRQQLAVEVRRVGAEPSKTAYTRENNAARECREYLKGAGYPLGDVVPLESFARVETRTGG